MIKGIFAGAGTALLILIGFMMGKTLGFVGEVAGALLGAGLATYLLRRSGLISKDSSLVSETKGVKWTKYVLFAIATLLLAVVAYYGIFS